MVLLALITQISFAQNYRIHGTVSDDNGEPIPFASVYIDATSYGTSTNGEGSYELLIPRGLQNVELITSLVGYKTKKTTIETGEQKNSEFNITLQGIILDEAVVEGKMDRFWRKKWKVFRNGLLGEVSPNRNYVFQNRDKIKLDYDDEDKFVFAKSSEPFYVVNETLGYKIKVDLQYFRSDGIYTKLSAYSFFEENPSEDIDVRTKQLQNRESTYFQTLRYFLVSLKEGKIDENKYDIYKINKMNQTFLGRTTLQKETSEGRLVPVSQKDIYAYDSKTNKHYLHTNQSLLIFNKNLASYQGNPFSDYYYEFSRIDLPNYLLEFNENGYITRPNGLTLYYHWSKEGLGRQLPEGYRPDGFEETYDPTKRQIESIEISPILAKQIRLDSLTLQSPESLNQLVTFNRMKEEDDEPTYFYEPDVTYKLAARDANQSIFQILKRVPSLRVLLNNNTGEYDIFLQGSNTSLMSGGGDKTPNLVINNRVYRTRQEVMDQLMAIDTRQVKEVGLIKYGGGAIFGATGGHGTIVVLMDNYRNVH
jgi:hypothetical protein